MVMAMAIAMAMAMATAAMAFTPLKNRETTLKNLLKTLTLILANIHFRWLGGGQLRVYWYVVPQPDVPFRHVLLTQRFLTLRNHPLLDKCVSAL